jgi:hypothetical protein
MHHLACRRHLVHAALAAALAGPLAGPRAQSADASALSALPIAVSIAAPGMVLSTGVILTVVAVQASADDTVCILERASDGARASVRLAGRAEGALALSLGTAVVVTAVSSGWVLAVASQAIAFVPNEIGAALLYDERVTR